VRAGAESGFLSAIVAADGRNQIMPVENAAARIGKSVEIRGEVKGSEDLIIDGLVEGTVTLTESRLTIGPNAQVAADLAAKDVLIMGRVQGNVVAGGRVELRAGCSVEGDIRALRLSVEDNAVFRGKVDLTQGAAKTPDATAAGGAIS
jgi:cytoskeletal protein CcmA (bactofilin family)